MTFRKKKPDYDHIARLERELADMDMLGPEIEEALQAKRSKRKEFFTPPILKKNTYEQPYWQFANGQTAAYSMSSHPHHVDSTNFVQIQRSALSVVLPPGVDVSRRDLRRLDRTLNPRPSRA